MDDPSDDDLYVFSGSDLLTSHYDLVDLDWREVVERSLLDQRRGLVIAQVAVLEDLIDEFILYLADPLDPTGHQARLDRQTLGPRLDTLEGLLLDAGFNDDATTALLHDLRRLVARRNELAHGTLYWQTVGPSELGMRDVTLEWVIESRRDRTSQRITTLILRNDLYEAIGTFSAMLVYAEAFVERAQPPEHFPGGHYLDVSSP